MSNLSRQRQRIASRPERGKTISSLKRSMFLAVPIVLLFILSACRSPFVVVVTATPTPTVIPTAAPAPITPTPAPVVDPNQPPGPQRLELDAVTNSIQIAGQLDAGATQRYVLAASTGQIMHVSIESAGQAILPNVSSPDGVVLKPYTNGLASWSGVLHANQDYFIDAVAAGSAASYTLTIRVDPAPSQPVTNTPTVAPITPTATSTTTPTTTPVVMPPIPAPERVVFAPDADRGTLSGTLLSNQPKQYILNAAEFQIMEIKVAAESAPVNLKVEIPSGAIWGGLPTPFVQYGQELIFTVPTSGDYIVSIDSGQNSPETRYEISFVIANATVDLPSQPAQRVTFAAGTTSAGFEGYFPSGGIKSYLLNASAGQEMNIRVIGYTADIPFTVKSPSGQTYLSELVPSEVAIRQAMIALPESGDYLITLETPFATRPSRFNVNFEVKDGVVSPPQPAPAERITFAPGGTTALRSGMLGQSAQERYVLNAAANQIMEVRVNGTTAQPNLSVTAPDGSVWPGMEVGVGSFDALWIMSLPQSGDYLVTIDTAAGAPESAYEARFVVMDPSDETPGEAPERIVFGAGATSASDSGYFSNGALKSYVLNASAGQRMEIRATGSSADVPFMVEGPSGQVWQAELLGSEVFIRQTTIDLPESGDYVVTVSVPLAMQPTAFSMSFTIEAEAVTPPQPPEPVAPERVVFSPGEISAAVGGALPSGGIKQYVLGAQSGQRMSVNVQGNQAEVTARIESPSGQLRQSEFVGAGSVYVHGVGWTLPESGDYVVTLSTPLAAPDTDYTVTFTIESFPATGVPPTAENSERITFAPGATAASVSGTVGLTKNFVLGAAAGQSLEARLVGQGVPLFVTLVTPSSTEIAFELQPSEVYIYGLQIVLPENGDYFITIDVPADVSEQPYTLNLSIE